MSWLFSQALVAAFLEDTSYDGEQFAPSSGSPIPQAYSSPDRTTVASRLSRYGMTCEPLTASHGEGLLMWSQADSRAKTSALQEKAPALTESAAECGRTWRGSLAKYDPATSSWRTAQFSLLEGLDESLATFARSGSMRSGMLFQRPTLERTTAENESGYWPTPDSSPRGPAADPTQKTRPSGAKVTFTLQSAVKLWPTPVADDTGSRSERYAQGGTPLSLAVRLWPTPTVEGNNRPGISATSGYGLRSAVLDWTGDVGPLNPPWVEWLMGWPLGWTDLKPLAMDKFREWRQQHSLHFEAPVESNPETSA